MSIPCFNFNCGSTEHKPWQCPLPRICSGCHSDQHLWAQCTAMCTNCGASNHKIDYCYDFEPGTSNKLANFPREMPLAWPYPVSYKTNYEAIKNGGGRFGPQIRAGGGGLLIPSQLTSKAPDEISLPAWFRPDPVRKATTLFGTMKDGGPSQGSSYMSTTETLSQVNIAAFNPPSGPKGRVAELRYASRTAYTTDLPLLPVSNPSRIRASSENFTKRNDALSQQRVMRVENAPPALTQRAIELLFYSYPMYETILQSCLAVYSCWQLADATAENQSPWRLHPLRNTLP